MKCAEVSGMLSAYTDGEMAGPKAAEMQAHIASCESCGAQFEALGLLHSKLTQMMREETESVDVVDLVMSSLPGWRRSPALRWALIGAAACLLAALGLCVLLAPSQVAPRHMVRRAPEPGVVKQDMVHAVRAPGQSGVQRHRSIYTAANTRRLSHHGWLRRGGETAKLQPPRHNHSPEPSRLVMIVTEEDGQRGRTIVLKSGDVTLYSAKQIEVSLPPNEDAATIVRPSLDIVESRGMPAPTYTGG